MIVDLGTGDGRFVVRTAAAAAGAAGPGSPTTLAIGIDANIDRMVDGVRRARKAKLGNALFVVANAERLPDELTGLADLVTVHFPWGSLLDGLLTADLDLVRGIAALLRRTSGRTSSSTNDSELTLLVSVTPKDRVPALAQLDERTARAVANGIVAATDQELTVRECRPATRGDIERAHSTWAKRLLAGNHPRQADRQAWRLRFGLAPSLAAGAGATAPAGAGGFGTTPG